MSALLEALLDLFGTFLADYAAYRPWTRAFLIRLAVLVGVVVCAAGGLLWWWYC